MTPQRAPTSPRKAVPPDERIPDVVLHLQTVFNRNCDAGVSIRQVDYKPDPVPPMEGKDVRWMADCYGKRG